MESRGAKQRWVTVSTSEGMFSTECAVELKAADGSTVSFFASRSLIESQSDGIARLRVACVQQDIDRGVELVLLPTETFQTGTRWIELPME